jgi:hypothetical protein
MQRRRRGSGVRNKDEAFTRADMARVLGVVLVLGAFLMLTFTPQLLFQARNLAGYSNTQAELLEGPGRSRSISVRVASTGEEISVRRTMFDTSVEHERIPIWYNPSAHLVFGITLFDMRVVSAQRYPELPTLQQALIAALLNVVLAAGGAYLVFRPPRGRRRSA